jgi:GNAT superfamily N-acetyltransferase
MQREELDLALSWAAEEGWNPGLRDAECFYAADPQGFLLASVGEELIACISVVRYGLRFAFLGLYIVRPEMRGRGFGLQLWQAGMQRLDGYTVGLDGVVAQQDNYRRSGFVLAHRNIRFGGSPVCEPSKDPRITAIDTDLVDDVIAYVRQMFLADRDSFLRCWLRPDQPTALALQEDAAIRGYGVVRQCQSGFKIGPLFADTLEGAEVLFKALVARCDREPVFLDCPEPNRSAMELATRHGMKPVFETARMYRGPAPSLRLDHIYGITTFELG